MNKQQIIVIICFIVVAIAVSLYFNFLKKKKYNELIILIQEQHYEEFDHLIEGKLIKLLFPPFNLDYLKLNSAIIRNDSNLIKKCFETLNSHRLNNKQAQEVYMKGFNYFITLEEYKEAKKYLDKINELENEQIKKEANRIYDIYALKGYRFLDEIIDETEDLDDMYKGVNEFLISLMYKNKGDKENSDKYHRLSEKHMKLLDRRISQNMKDKKKIVKK